MAGLVLLAWAVAACAPNQRVALELEPMPVEVYVDGRRVEGETPEYVELAANRSHIVMFKREGYRSQQIAIQSTRTLDGYRLIPATIRVALRPADPRGHSVQIELDDPGAEPGSDPGVEPGPADASSQDD